MQEVKPVQDFQRSRRDNLTRRWNLPAQNKNFTGRQNLLDQISERLSGSKPLVITACHGLGGVGKTQLVTEFAYRNQKKYERIIWIAAESADQIETAYLSLGQDLGIIPEKTPPTEVIHMVKAWLSDHPRNLVIFDNAPDNKTVEGYELSSGADILITSRNKDWEGGLAVDVFSLQEAVLYFRKIVGERAGDSKEKIEELAEELGRLPLALAQAAAYIRQNKISIQAYLDLYQEKKAYLLSLSVLSESDHHATVFITWDISMERIKQESVLAPGLLNICSYLHSQKIPALLLEPFCEDEKYNPEKRETLEEARGCLRSYSMVSVDEEDESVSVHRLVQDVTRLKIINESFEYLVVVGQLMVKSFPFGDKSETIENIEIMRVLLGHLERLEEAVSDWIRTLKTPKEQLDAQWHFKDLLELLHHGCSHLGLAQKDKSFLCRLLTLYETAYGKQHKCVADTLNVLGIASGELGQYDESKAFYQRSLSILEKLSGKKSPDYAIVLSNLGGALHSLGNVYEQKDVLHTALPILEQYYGRDHHQVANTLVNLALAAEKMGELQEARKFLERALEIREKCFGKDHYKVAQVLGNLSGLSVTLPEKKTLCKRILLILENHFGNEHFEVGMALVNLGGVYRNLGNVNKAHKLLERALVIFERHFGPNHEDLLPALSGLGAVHVGMRDFDTAKKYFKRGVSIAKQHFGSAHSRFCDALGDLANVYGDLGKPLRKKELLEYVLSVEERNLSGEHPKIAETLNNLSILYGDLDMPKEFKQMIQRALDIFEKNYGENDYRVGHALRNLANAHGLLNEMEEQRKCLERALAIYRLNQFHSGIVEVLTTLARCCGDLEDMDSKREHLEVALATAESCFSPTHSAVAEILDALAVWYCESHQPTIARELVVRAYQISLQNPDLGVSHPDTVRRKRNLATVTAFIKNANVEAAEERLLEEPNNTQLRLKLARFYLGEDNIEKSILHYEAVIALLEGESAASAHHNLACMYDVKNQIELAAQHFELALVYRSGACTYADYGLFLYKQGRFQDAIENLLKIFTLVEDKTGLSYGQLELVRLDEFLQKEIQLHGDLSVKPIIMAYYLIIRCYQQLGEEAECENYLSKFRQAVEISADPLCWRLSSYTYEYLGKTNEAEKCREMLSAIEFSKQLTDAEAAAQFGLHSSPPRPLKREKLEASQEKLACTK